MRQFVFSFGSETVNRAARCTRLSWYTATYHDIGILALLTRLERSEQDEEIGSQRTSRKGTGCNVPQKISEFPS